MEEDDEDELEDNEDDDEDVDEVWMKSLKSWKLRFNPKG